jgi:pentatricopeptide repeat protein
MKLLKKERAIGNALVDMYGRFSMLAKAMELFEELTVRDVVSWTAQISGYIQHGYNEDALKCFDQMQLEGLHPSVITYSCILKACGTVRLLNKGQEIHAEIERRGLLGKDLTLGVCLVDMYAKCDMVARAQQVFDEIHARTVMLWTSLISGYADHGPYLEAVKCLGKMQLEGIAPNIVTLICILKAYAGLGDGSEIEKLYVQIEQRGWFEGNLIIGNALVNAYAKCGCLTKAQQVFDRLPLRDVASWNALITGLLEYDYGQAAVECFKHMQLEGVPPNEETLAYGLKACRTIGATSKGCEIRDEIEEIGLFESDIVLGNTLIDMYAKFGWFSKALEVFEGLVVRDVVSWNALIAGYVEHEDWRGALEWFEQMQVEGVSPDSITLICGLKACGRLGAADKGQQIHADSERKGLFEQEIALGNALIDMYAKCNMLTIAQNALHKLPVRDVVTWSALIGGYGQHGHQNDVFYMFEKMVNDGIRPDSVTFSLLLNACSRTGSSEKSRAYFKTMSEDFAIVPTLEHLNSVIDLLCRAGQLGDAEAVMDKMPFWPDLVVWHSILSACRNCGNRRLAKKAFKNILHLDGSNSAAYVLMSYICAGIGVLEALPERVG